MSQIFNHYRNKLIRLVYITLLAILPLIGNSQSLFIPHSISDNINTEYDELNPVLSPEGNRIYFVRINHPQNYYGIDGSQDIWFSDKQPDGTWSVPKRINANFNRARNNAILAISMNGQDFLISGQYTGKNHIWKKRGLSLVHTTSDSSFSNPLPVKIPKYHRINKGLSSNTFLSIDEDVLILAFTKKWKKENLNLYVSTKNDKDKWKSPKKLSKNISKEFKSASSPFLSDDGETLYFSGYRKGKENLNRYDIYSCTKTDGTFRNWSNPTKLSDTVNSEMWDSYFKTFAEGSWASFATNRDPKNKSDIYLVKLFEDNPYVEIKGFITNSYKDTSFVGEVKILVNGVEADSVTINDETSEYTLVLPLGEKYEIQASSDNYTAETLEVDVSEIEEFTQMEKDLPLTPLPYVLVSGKYLDSKTKELIPLAAKPRLVINNQIIDTLDWDDPSSYQIKLPWGESYSFQVLADHYEAQKMRLDLTLVENYKEIELDLEAEKFQKFAVLTGKVLNKKTELPLDVPFVVNLNDEPDISSRITQETGQYYLELPLGKEYTLNASAKGFFPVYEMIDLKDEKANIKILKDLFLAPLEIGEHIRINNIFFEHNSFVLKPESYHDLQKVADLLKEYTQMKIEIGGHTDSWGSNSLNQKLSEDRAKSVQEYITAQGVSQERVTYKGYGEEKPIESNRTEKGRSQNRRVEFTIIE